MTIPAYPKWMPDPRAYEIEQERYRHDEAMAHFGEYAMFVLMWDHDDFLAGLVDECSECVIPYGKIAEAYGQSAKEKCETCFGTRYEGGVKAKIVRVSIWDANEETDHEHIRGEVSTQSASIQSTSDFRLRVHDYVFRGDGTRWQVASLSTNHLRAGFDMPTRIDTPLGYNYGQVAKEEDPASVAYMIPPTDPEDLEVLDAPFERYPVDFTSIEVINGPLT